jgi:hypothetical protein
MSTSSYENEKAGSVTLVTMRSGIYSPVTVCASRSILRLCTFGNSIGSHWVTLLPLIRSKAKWAGLQQRFQYRIVYMHIPRLNREQVPSSRPARFAHTP